MSAEPQITYDAKSIRALRAELGLTQVEFARLLDVTPATVGRWERGQTLVQRRLQSRLDQLATSAHQGETGQAIAPVHDILSRQEWSPPRPEAMPSRKDFVEALLIGLRNGHVAADDWADVARFVGREFYDADWQ